MPRSLRKRIRPHLRMSVAQVTNTRNALSPHCHAWLSPKEPLRRSGDIVLVPSPAAHQRTMPPSTFRVWPVMKRASSEARKATAAAMPSGWPLAGDRLKRLHEAEAVVVRACLDAVGFGEAGCHRIDVDAVLAKFGGERPSEGEDTALRSHIGGHIGRAGEDDVRADVDDAPLAALLAHQVRGGARHQEDTRQIDLDEPAPMDRVDVIPRNKGHDRGIVDKDVDASSLLHHGLVQGGDGGLVRHVAGDGEGAAADRLRDSFGACRVDVGDRDARALARQAKRDGFADALGRAGDNATLPLKRSDIANAPSLDCGAAHHCAASMTFIAAAAPAPTSAGWPSDVSAPPSAAMAMTA
jgi:hypothetical protein